MICTRSVYISKLLLFTIFISKVNKVVKKKQNKIVYLFQNTDQKTYNQKVLIFLFFYS